MPTRRYVKNMKVLKEISLLAGGYWGFHRGKPVPFGNRAPSWIFEARVPGYERASGKIEGRGELISVVQLIARLCRYVINTVGLEDIGCRLIVSLQITGWLSQKILKIAFGHLRNKFSGKCHYEFFNGSHRVRLFDNSTKSTIVCIFNVLLTDHHHYIVQYIFL